MQSKKQKVENSGDELTLYLLLKFLSTKNTLGVLQFRILNKHWNYRISKDESLWTPAKILLNKGRYLSDDFENEQPTRFIEKVNWLMNNFPIHHVKELEFSMCLMDTKTFTQLLQKLNPLFLEALIVTW